MFLVAAEGLLRRRPADHLVREVVVDRIRASRKDGRRREALSGLLLKHWPTAEPVVGDRDRQDVMGKLLIVRDRTDGLVRSRTAADALLSKLRAVVEEQNVVAYLCENAVAAKDHAIRHNAVVLLDRAAPAEPEIAAFLANRLNEDDNVDVFRAVARSLLRRRPADPLVRAAIARRATVPRDSRWRQVLRGLVTAHWPDDPTAPCWAPLVAVLTADRTALPTAGSVLVEELFRETRLGPAQMREHLLALVDPVDGLISDGFFWQQEANAIVHRAMVALDDMVPEDAEVDAILHHQLRRAFQADRFRGVAETLLRRHRNDPTLWKHLVFRIDLAVGNDQAVTDDVGLAAAELLAAHWPGNPRAQVLAALCRTRVAQTEQPGPSRRRIRSRDPPWFSPTHRMCR